MFRAHNPVWKQGSSRVSPAQGQVAYRELYGRLEPGSGGAAAASAMLASDAVVFSNIEHGSAASAPVPGLSIRYVARGCENYRIGGRGYRVGEGQVMIAPHEQGAECEIRKDGAAGTLGLCTLVRGATEELQWVFGPLVLGTGCSPLGPMLHETAKALRNPSPVKKDVARQLVARLRRELPNVTQSFLAQAAAVEAAKASTRFEMVRRANLAQAYLHSVTDHAVDLHELSAAVGASPFRLLTSFQKCFGETPASYHRRLRLTLALEEARRRQLPISAIADAFGFAGASSFSHAYRRSFGHAPVWRKSEG
jgi:AraC-like DNA-binding protein